MVYSHTKSTTKHGKHGRNQLHENSGKQRYATTKQLLSQEKDNFKMVGKISSISTLLSAQEGFRDDSWYSQCEALVHGSRVNKSPS